MPDKDEPRLRDLSNEKDREEYQRDMEYYNRRFKEEGSFRGGFRTYMHFSLNMALVRIAIVSILLVILACVLVFAPKESNTYTPVDPADFTIVVGGETITPFPDGWTSEPPTSD